MRWDGKGYPDQLKGTELHLGNRILAVADVYDALYSERPCRKGWSQEKALNYLQKEAGKSFDPEIVAALCKQRPATRHYQLNPYVSAS